VALSVTAAYETPTSPLWKGVPETASGAVGDGLGDGSALGVVWLRGVIGGRVARGGAQAARTRKIPTERTAQPLLTDLHAGV